MIEHILATGDKGQLRIRDNTDDAGLMNVEMAVRSLSPVSIPQMPWTYSINGIMSGWKSFNFKDTTLWQNLGVVHVGTAQRFTLHLGGTGTSQLGGPTDHQIDLYGYVPPSGGGGSGKVRIKIDGVYKLATPFVNVNGVWKQATPLVRSERGWTQLA